MSSVYKSAYTDLNGTVSFGGGGGGGGGGSSRQERRNNFHRNRNANRPPARNPIDFNNNGKVGDELTLAAGVGAGMLGVAAPEPGTTALGVVTIAASVANYYEQ